MLPRGPEEERLKAVWSQASDKAGLPIVNSLEKIGDDLTALPFTLQDVKSEQGTPPPPSTLSGPSRMSLSEVTRAFQQVPQSTSNPPASSNAINSPPTAPVASANFRSPTGYAYAPTMSGGGMRPPYPPYGSPMLSSPSPTIIYPPVAPSPAPRPMNGQTTPYATPMWMPVSPAATVPNGVMRPIPSPYPQPIMTYPAQGPPMYPQPPGMHTPGTPVHTHAAAGRGRGMPMVSPVAGHAPPHGVMPMYAGSPVMMQPPVMAMNPSHSHSYPSPISAGRTPARPYDAQSGIPQAGHPHGHALYAPATTPYARPGW
jgi:serine/arginine repetitive matrix protein 2